MRILRTVLLATAGMASSLAAQSAELDRIQLGVLLSPATQALTGGDASALQRVFEVALADKGMGAALPGIQTRFVAYIDLVPLQEELLPGGMVVLVERVSVTFGDGISGRSVASYQTDARAVGKSKETALRNLSTSLRLRSDADWNASLQAANTGIINYFEQGCDAMLREMDAKVKQKEFDEAIYQLTTVPREARDCHGKALNAASAAYTAKLKALCAGPYAAARTKWAASKSRASAASVANIIADIPADSPCFKEASVLMNGVAAVIAGDDAKAAQEHRDRMALAAKHYDDGLALARQKVQGENALASQTIEAARQVGLEQAKKKGPLINIQKWSKL